MLGHGGDRLGTSQVERHGRVVIDRLGRSISTSRRVGEPCWSQRDDRSSARRALGMSGSGWLASSLDATPGLRLSMRLDPGIDSRFLAIASQPVSRTRFRAGSTGAARVELPTSRRASRRSSASCPPLEEQRRIAEILDTIDDTIQATERIIAKLEPSADAVFSMTACRDLAATGWLDWRTSLQDDPVGPSARPSAATHASPRGGADVQHATIQLQWSTSTSCHASHRLSPDSSARCRRGDVLSARHG